MSNRLFAAAEATAIAVQVTFLSAACLALIVAALHGLQFV